MDEIGSQIKHKKIPEERNEIYRRSLEELIGWQIVLIKKFFLSISFFFLQKVPAFEKYEEWDIKYRIKNNPSMIFYVGSWMKCGKLKRKIWRAAEEEFKTSWVNLNLLGRLNRGELK